MAGICDISILFFVVTSEKPEGRQHSNKGLSCFHCHTLSHGEFCSDVNKSSNDALSMSHSCSLEELYCMVGIIAILGISIIFFVIGNDYLYAIKNMKLFIIFSRFVSFLSVLMELISKYG